MEWLVKQDWQPDVEPPEEFAPQVVATHDDLAVHLTKQESASYANVPCTKLTFTVFHKNEPPQTIETEVFKVDVAKTGEFSRLTFNEIGNALLLTSPSAVVAVQMPSSRTNCSTKCRTLVCEPVHAAMF